MSRYLEPGLTARRITKESGWPSAVFSAEFGSPTGIVKTISQFLRINAAFLWNDPPCPANWTTLYMLYAAFCSAATRLLAPALVLAIVSPCVASAQLQGKIAAKPIAIGYARNVTPKRMIDYVLALTERLEIGTMMRTQMDAGTGSHAA